METQSKKKSQRDKTVELLIAVTAGKLSEKETIVQFFGTDGATPLKKELRKQVRAGLEEAAKSGEIDMPEGKDEAGLKKYRASLISDALVKDKRLR